MIVNILAPTLHGPNSTLSLPCHKRDYSDVVGYVTQQIYRRCSKCTGYIGFDRQGKVFMNYMRARIWKGRVPTGDREHKKYQSRQSVI